MQTMNSLQSLQLHGWFMWASMGFLFPLGTLLIRYNRKPGGGTVSNCRTMFLFDMHKYVQILGFASTTAGIVTLLVKTGPSFDYTHQRLGLALFIITLGLPIIGYVRPQKGTQWRPYWFMLHWGLGTSLLFLGIVNCYIGINAYQHITNLSLRTLNILFSIQVALMALMWVLQDRWYYIWNGQTNVAARSVDSNEAAKSTLPV